MFVKIVGFILVWIGFIGIKLPTWIFGLFMVPLIYKYRETPYDDLPWWTRPWANPEDHKGGINSYAQSLPKWWINREGISFRSWYRYHAIRNGANGLRSFEFLDLDVDPDKMHFIQSADLPRFEPKWLRLNDLASGWYLAWQGHQAGFKFVHIWNDERHFVFKIGWRIDPSDALRSTTKGALSEDAGFASKLLVYRRG